MCENGAGAVCTARALNEMNACAQPHPNYREWRGGNKWKKKKQARGCSVGGDGREE